MAFHKHKGSSIIKILLRVFNKTNQFFALHHKNILKVFLELGIFY